jgi:hypothetical protein
MDTQKICVRCGSPLVEISKKTTQLENFKASLTTTAYRCTNDECQAESDRRKAEAEKQRVERAEIQAKKMAAKNNPNETQ